MMNWILCLIFSNKFSSSPFFARFDLKPSVVRVEIISDIIQVKNTPGKSNPFSSNNSKNLLNALGIHWCAHLFTVLFLDR